MTALLWFRRELRMHDNPVLRAALDRGQPVVPVFVFDDQLLAGRHASGPRTQFLLECLADLDGSLRELGSRLVLRRGRPEQELPALARELDVKAVLMSADVSPFATRRDRRTVDGLARAGVEVSMHPGLFAVDSLASIQTGGGDPYTVFTPFHRSWLAHPRRQVLGAPQSLPALPRRIDRGAIPELAEFGLEQVVPEPAAGGEQAGREAMRRFITGPIEQYSWGRNELGEEQCSRLSPYLHFGCISPRELEHRLPAGAGAESFRRQLCWRDFYAHVLLHFPANARCEYQERYRGTIKWSHARARFEAWQQGRTGFPLVDAAMRQLGLEGWMHNRARLVVGSFLTKDLGLDWRWGERWFMRHLLDGDEASNNGNWQWIASVGVDPAPAFRRIFNPARQQQRFDPEGSFVRRYVPELGDVPHQYLTEPWKMPEDVQRQVGCVIGADYPEPIVDHAAARREALARYRRP